jgi:hypothetical protein
MTKDSMAQSKLNESLTGENAKCPGWLVKKCYRLEQGEESPTGEKGQFSGWLVKNFEKSTPRAG